MRCLYRKKALSLVKELDAFPKVPESYVETTATGGTELLILFHHDKLLFKTELCFTANTLSWNLTVLFLHLQ
ncbi:unnamed protein product [Oncorhynchus mykiss]|uniref:Uncharacterized protein n=1 Tax=Oncorhynchus mykiss TaxID=8022 RepID=A0A060VYJ2_ONCMY|nr:unnamed protein product [Oncorhynchus mykiss]